MFVARQICVIACSTLAAFILSSCRQDAQVPKNPLDCFPEEAKPWIAATGKEDDRSPRRSASGRGVIYVDRSGSMAGYINGATNLERPLQDIVATLPGALQPLGIRTSVRAFGRTISPDLPDAGRELTRAAAYSCDKAQPAACDNAETRIDGVLDQIAEQKSRLAVIVSDLWFTNSEVASSGIAELKPRLEKLLLEGRMIAVYGLAAPFAGTIYDLPDAGADRFSVPYTGRHPLYMLVIGDAAAVDDFDAALRASGSRYLAEGRTRSGAIRRTIFMLDPVRHKAGSATPLSVVRHPRLERSNFDIPAGLAIQRYALRDGLPDRSGTRRPAPSWTGPDDTSFVTDAVWTGPLQTQTRIWKRASRQCSAKSWVGRNPSAAGWETSGSARRSTFTLDPDRFAATLGGKGDYLIVAEIERELIDQPNAATQWMRGAWNLDPERAEATANAPGTIFPTLNLSEFGRLLETALASAADTRNRPILGFAVMVRIKG